MQRVARSMGVPEGEIKRFVSESPWEHERVQQHLIENVPAQMAAKHGAFIVDDVGIVKQGKHSVGVQRQYSGTLKQVGNCQVAVNVVYAVPGDQFNADQRTWPLGTRLYVGKAWAENEEYETRRQEVRLPTDFQFKTKPEIAIDMIDAARHAVPHRVTLADAGYGDDGTFRQALRQRNEPYILGITPTRFRLIPADTTIIPPGPTGKGGRPSTTPTHEDHVKRESPAQIAANVKEWTTIKWSEGTKGTLSGLFHATKVRVVTGVRERRHVTDEVCWLLLEKTPKQLRAYVCWGLDETPLHELVAYAHLRWTIEQFHKEAKQLLGFDRFEGRTWRGWHHHITVVLLAYAFLANLRAQSPTEQHPTLPTIAKALVIERETQDIIREEGLPPDQARRLAERAVRTLTDW